MKRKMIGAASAYMSGLFFASFFTDVKGVLIYASAAALVFIFGKRKGFSRRDLAVIAVSFAAAVTISLSYTFSVYDKITGYIGQTGSFSGRVTGYTRYDSGKAAYTLNGRINGETKAKIYYYGDELSADYGDIINIENCVFSAQSSSYLYDNESYYRSRHIYLSAANAGNVTAVQTDSRRIKKLIMSYREKMISDFRMTLGNDCGSFLAGMVFGEKQELDDSLRTSLYRTGIGHVLAVSGLHVSIIAAMMMWVMRRLRVNKYAAFAIMNALLLLLTAMANYPVSAVRAAIMLDIMYSARLFYRQNDPLNSLAAASLLICIADPYAVYSAGFLLSLSGTFGVTVLAPYMTAKMEKNTILQRLAVSLTTAICTTISVFPMSVYFFGETSLIAPFANILLLPLCSASMVFGLMYILSFGALPTLYAAGALIKIVLFISDVISTVGFFHISDSSGVLSILLIFSGALVLIVFLFSGSRRKTAILTAAAVAVFSAASSVTGLIRRRGFTAAVLGSGTNAAVVVTHGGHTDIIDLSGHYRSAAYVRRYLLVNGIPYPDTIILTKNVQSQYSAYANELELSSAGKWIAAGDTGICCGSAGIVGGETFSAENSGCIIEYDRGVLDVSYKDIELTFAPVSAETDTAGLDIYYGRISGDDVPERGGIYLDETDEADEIISGMNNFEIIISDDGEYKIRRL